MLKNPSSHLTAVFQALFVTFLWSTSWVLIKIGLADIPPLTFAGLRYSLAFISLVPFFLRPEHSDSIRGLSRREWLKLAVLGLLFYAITQGAQFLGLSLLPAVTVSLLLNFTSIFVTLMGVAFLAEMPTWRQWLGMGLSVLGGALYFYPPVIPEGQVIGLFAVTVGVMANAASAVLGRQINQTGAIHPLTVTLVSMGIGSVALVTGGVMIQGLPRLSLFSWGIIFWLAIVNTAFAFTLYNHTLRTLSAMQSSIINNTMLIQIAILAWIFLGENLNWQELLGMLAVALGTLLVQLKPRKEAGRLSPTLAELEK